MRLALYLSVPQGDAPNLVALQDEALAALPTVLVCPLKERIALTPLRAEIAWGERTLIACTELARPIRGRVSVQRAFALGEGLGHDG